MIQIMKLGEKTCHDQTFMVDRPLGHPVYLLLITLKPGLFFIENEWMKIPAYTAFLFLPGQKHLYRAIDNTTEKPAYMDNWVHISSPLRFLPEHFPYGKPISLHQPEDYLTLFHLINNEFFGASPKKENLIDHLMNALLLKLCTETDTKEYPPIYYDLVALRKEIYAFPFHEWRIPDIAEHLNISSGYLHACYKDFFGITCMNDVIKSRIEYACDLLSSTQKSIEEIAIQCGYHHTEHFIRQFKTEMHMTPLQWKKRNYLSSPF